MILVLWLARVLNRLAHRMKSRPVERWADAVYAVYFGRENRKAFRASVARERDEIRRRDAAIADVIAETRPRRRVGAPIHRDR